MAKRIMRNFLEAVGASGKEKTKPYDTAATVTRIEGSTAWVHIDGGVDETPVQLTIDAKPGDTVRVRVSGGQAWLTGNGSAPPTDDTMAVKAEVKAEKADVLAQLAKKTADQAGKTATNYLYWSSEYGLIVSEDATEDPTEMQGGNTRITSNGMSIYKGDQALAQFGTESVIYTDDGTELAHFGYASGTAESGTAVKPYYTFGERKSNRSVGNYSVAEGKDVAAEGYASHVSGVDSIAASYAYASHVFGEGLWTNVPNQMVIGKYNSPAYGPLVIGDGDSSAESNCLTVDWDGYVSHKNDGVYNIKSKIINGSPASVVSAQLRIWGNVAQLYLEFNNASNIGAGDDVFTGTIYDQTGVAKIPAQYVTGVGYYGARAIVGRINTSGDIVVRNASASAISSLSSGVSLSFTYIFT